MLTDPLFYLIYFILVFIFALLYIAVHSLFETANN